METLLDPDLARAYRVVPLGLRAGVLQVAAADLGRPGLANELAFALGRAVQLVDLQSGEVEQLLAERYPVSETKDVRVEEDPPVKLADGSTSPEGNEAPVVRLVQRLLEQAVEAGASDVHLEPFEDRFVIR
ncbi:MAG: hypothetical protein JSR48_07575, partial [Verrucomicrobia bacterium]|nr:hypothetical protein [Verrucomicrobiota bacterium]